MDQHIVLCLSSIVKGSTYLCTSIRFPRTLESRTTLYTNSKKTHQNVVSEQTWYYYVFQICHTLAHQQCHSL